MIDTKAAQDTDAADDESLREVIRELAAEKFASQSPPRKFVFAGIDAPE